MKRLITLVNFILVFLFISWELNAQVALPTFQPFLTPHEGACDGASLDVGPRWSQGSESRTHQLILVDDQGTTHTFNQVNRGWKKHDGTGNTSGSSNTYTGLCSGTIRYRSYFIFDLTSFSATVSTATLRLEYESFWQTNNGNTAFVAVYDVSTSRNDMNNTAAVQSRYDDLGTGHRYAVKCLQSSEAPRTVNTCSGSFTTNHSNVILVDWTLDSQGVTDVNAKAGDYFIVGLTLVTE